MADITPIQRALLSVYHKDGIVDMARILHESGVELLSSTGTYLKIKEAGLPVIDVSDYTGWPPMFDHRVATLHPKIHGGLLYMRDKPAHVETAKEYKIPPIDLVVVNLYPVEEAIATGDLTQVIEKTDIGGPALIRGGAKNHHDVAVVVDPADYMRVANAIQQNGGLTLGQRRLLAQKVYETTAAYDTKIAAFYRESLRGLRWE